jgi:hypothetical protein
MSSFRDKLIWLSFGVLVTGVLGYVFFSDLLLNDIGFNETETFDDNSSSEIVEDKEWVFDHPDTGFDVVDDLSHLNASCVEGEWNPNEVKAQVNSYSDFLNISKNKIVFFSQRLSVRYYIADPVIFGDNGLLPFQELAGVFNILIPGRFETGGGRWEYEGWVKNTDRADKVELYMDGELIREYSGKDSYKWKFNTEDYENGLHRFRVILYKDDDEVDQLNWVSTFVDFPENYTRSYWFEMGLNETKVEDRIAFCIHPDMIMFQIDWEYTVYGNLREETFNQRLLSPIQ